VKIAEIARLAPVIPVIVIDRVEDAVPLAQALVQGGLPVLEVTLRTPAAFEAMRAMAQVPGAVVGAGTVLDARQYAQVAEAGARFAVSPGYTGELAAAARANAVPWLPGAVTASEVMRARADGLRLLKFFPAQAAGGVPVLKAFASVFPDMVFCPTGGVTVDNAASYFAAGNVLCVGGSWLTPKEAVAAGDWAGIEALARAAAALRRSS
jgi:2-dehydro-3-deoxyphosphogluconate aldolase/(4S)-4-hydroxy-2-oxoglutarate aldolase